MFYSKETNGFYDTAIHGNNMPADVVHVEDSVYAEMMSGQQEGKNITGDANGNPVLTTESLVAGNPFPISPKEAALNYLNATDWYFARLAETGQEVPAEVLTKRAEARALLNT